MNLEEVGELTLSNFRNIVEVPEYGACHGRSTLNYAAGCAALGLKYSRKGVWRPSPIMGESPHDVRQGLTKLLSLANELHDFLKENEYFELIEKLARISYDQILTFDADEASTARLQWRMTIGAILAQIWLDFAPRLYTDYPKNTPKH